MDADHPAIGVNFARRNTLQDDAAITGVDGSDFFEELRRIGYDGKDTLPEAAAYFELHIEQGAVLEELGLAAGIVTGAQGVRWFEIEVTGTDAHAGTTPMHLRQDSFMTAARLVLDFRDQAAAISPDLRFTCGRVEVLPNSQNTIPGLTRLGLDVRHLDQLTLDRMESEIFSLVEKLGAKPGEGGWAVKTMEVAPVMFDANLTGELRSAAKQLGIAITDLPSGAMHDASSIALKVASAMIFVRSKGGISHNPAEYSSPEDIGVACSILASAVASAAGC